MTIGLFSSVFEKRWKVSQEPPGWIIKGSGWDNASGVDVDPDNALESTPFAAAVSLLAESVAGLPLIIYERLEKGRRRAAEHYLYELLHYQTNPYMTAFEYRETVMGHTLTWGNGLAEKELNKAGETIALWPIPPNRVEMLKVKSTNEIVYKVTLPDGTPTYLPKRKVFHIRAYSSNGYWGISPTQRARLAIGLTQATEQFGAKFFSNGGRPSGVLTVPGVMSDEAYKRLKKEWVDTYGGLSNSQRVALLEEGTSYEKIGVPPNEAQFLESRKFQVSEMARIFRVPPHMIGDLDKATFSNIEQQSLDFVIHCLRPWLVRWEQAVRRDLIIPSDRQKYYAEFLVDGLLRGDTESRYKAYGTGRQWGWLTANEIREKENLNPIDGGDELMVPLNMMPASEIGQRSGWTDGETRELSILSESMDFETRGKQSAAIRRRLMLAIQPSIEDMAGRIIRREVNDIRAAARKQFGGRGKTDFLNWLDEFLNEHVNFIFRQMIALALGYGEQVAEAAAEEVGLIDLDKKRLERFIRRYVNAFASRRVDQVRRKVEKVLNKAANEDGDPLEYLENDLGTWEESQAVTIGREESTRLNGAVSETVFFMAGFTSLIWRNYGDSCPYCKSLDGKVVGRDEWFLQAGMEFLPDGADKALTPQRNVRHPPAHKGCDCLISAGI